MKYLIVTKIVILSLLLSSCATTYRGEAPKFEGNKEERLETYLNYKFKEGYWVQNTDAFTMGDDEQLYTLESLRPVIDKVAPKEVKTELKRSEIASMVGLGLVGAAIGMLFLGDDVEDWSSGKKAAYWSLLGLSLTGSYVSIHFINRAAKRYNEGLREKLSLGIKASLNY